MLNHRAMVLGILQSMKVASNQHSSSVPDKQLRQILRNELTTRMQDLDEPTIVKIESLLQTELANSEVTAAANLPRLPGCSVSLWQGDITKLKIGAIVNAANDQMCGCFRRDHPCIDNAIHSAAGPRLRMACKELMQEQGHAEPTGQTKLTPAFSLPSDYVLHTVGPIFQGQEQPEMLASCYTSCLDLAAAKGISSVAFCCISTGVFGYPQQAAAQVALTAVKRWLDRNADKQMHVVFNTFLPNDAQLYNHLAPAIFRSPDIAVEPDAVSSSVQLTEENSIALAGRWIEDADAVLICAGAGMSAQDGYNVYVSEEDFARHYPELTRYGYRTGYECMGLFGDRSVPDDVKWRYQAQHMKNMRYLFPPNAGHALLLDLVGEKEHFVWTSNVDGCFERAGFERSRVYTPQGEWGFYQCRTPCRPDAVFASPEMLDKVLASGAAWTPSCPHCKGKVFGNVRADGGFIHAEYEETSRRLQQWLESVRERGLRVVVVEVGAGFNTPTVTRFPMESLAMELPQARLVRINPAEAEVPVEVPRALSFKRGWEVLREMRERGGRMSRAEAAAVDAAVEQKRAAMPRGRSHVQAIKARFGHYDWREFLRQLRD